MRYNETDGIEINGKTIITDEIDDAPVFETSCVVIGGFNASSIKANFDLIVIGDVTGGQLEVSGGFTCIGNVDIENIVIQGSCHVEGSLTTENGFVGDKLLAQDICANVLEVKSEILCCNLECNENTSCEGKALVAEGIMGTGEFIGSLALCGEFSMLEESNNIIVADSVEELKEMIESSPKERNEIDIEKWNRWGRVKSTPAYLNELEMLVAQTGEYKQELNTYKKIKRYENYSGIPDFKAYIEIMDLLNRKYVLIQESQLYKKVKSKFEGITYDDINHSKMPSITQKDFSKMLYILMQKKDLFNDDIRELLLETLYVKIGINYEDVCDSMEES